MVKILTLRLSQKLYQKVSTLADERGLSKSDIIRAAIHEFKVKKEEK